MILAHYFFIFSQPLSNPCFFDVINKRQIYIRHDKFSVGRIFSPISGGFISVEIVSDPSLL